MMSVPEASMDEYYLSQPCEHQIWRSWKVATMEAKAIAQPVSELANDDFRFGILAFYASHEGGALRVDRFACEHSPEP
jgi:hypothetical protein